MAYPTATSILSWAGAANPAYLTTTLSSSYVETTFTLNSASTWTEVSSTGQATANALGTSGLFVVTVDFGLSTEEKILCSAVNTGTGVVTIWTDGTYNGRGWDGTTISAHSAGSSSSYNCFPAVSAAYLRQTNAYVATSAQLNLANTFTSNPQTISAGTASAVGLVVQGAAGQTADLADFKNSGGSVLASVSSAGEIVGRDFAPSGLTGATAATRYVGGTTSGAPTTGTFAVGDFVLDQQATLWVCIIAGTPGTWSPVPANSIYRTSTTRTALLGEITLVVGSGSGVTITLPANPVSGSTFSVINNANNTISIKGGSYPISISGHNYGAGISYSVSANGIYSFVFSATDGVWFCISTNDIGDMVNYTDVSLSAFGAPTGNISVGSNKITSLANATASTDAVAYGQVSGRMLTPTVKTSAYTASAGDFVIMNGTGNITVTLPTAPANGSIVGVLNIQTSGTTSIAAGSGDSIRSSTTSAAATAGSQYQVLLYCYNSTSLYWEPIVADANKGYLARTNAWVGANTFSGSTTTFSGTTTTFSGSTINISGTTLSVSATSTFSTSINVTGSATFSGSLTLPNASVTNAALANSSLTVNGTSISLGASGTVTAAAGTLTGTTLNSTVVNSSLTKVGLASAGFVKSDASGNLSVDTNSYALSTAAVTVNGTSISLGASGTIKASTTNALTIGTGLSGTSFDGSSAVTVAIDSTVATLSGSQTLTNKTLTAPIITYTVNAQTGTTFTPSASDAAAIVTLSNASAISVTIPTNATTPFAIGSQINFIQIGAGQVTISAATPATTTIASNASTSASPKLRVQYSSATAIKVATDTWYVVGDIS